MNFLTGIKDLDLLILEKLTDVELLTFRKINNYTESLFLEERFWIKRFHNKYGQFSKSEDRTWRDFYFSLFRINSESFRQLRIFHSLKLDRCKSCLAIERGDLDCLKYFCHFDDCCIKCSFMLGKKNLLEAIDILKDKRCFYPDQALFGAIEGEHKETFKYYISLGAKQWEGALCYASSKNEEFAEIFIREGARDFNCGMYHAARGGNEKMVKFFIQKGANEWEFGRQGACISNNANLILFFEEKLKERDIQI